jgi:uncharacterized protein
LIKAIFIYCMKTKRTKGRIIMDITAKILEHPKYIEYMECNAATEKDRLFCKHDLQHALDVARVAYIICLERRLEIPKELLYAAALLHDIAKWKQYQHGTDHALEGSILAGKILLDIGVSAGDAEVITKAIKTHRQENMEKSVFGKVLYESDKACRPCVFCKSIHACHRFQDGKEAKMQY